MQEARQGPTRRASLFPDQPLRPSITMLFRLATGLQVDASKLILQVEERIRTS